MPRRLLDLKRPFDLYLPTTCIPPSISWDSPFKKVHLSINRCAGLLDRSGYAERYDEEARQADRKYNKLPPGFSANFLCWIPRGYNLQVGTDSRRCGYALISIRLRIQYFSPMRIRVQALSSPSSFKKFTFFFLYLLLFYLLFRYCCLGTGTSTYRTSGNCTTYRLKSGHLKMIVKLFKPKKMDFFIWANFAVAGSGSGYRKGKSMQTRDCTGMLLNHIGKSADHPHIIILTVYV